MGNCVATEPAAVVIEHPDGTMEKSYWPISAFDVMGSNPGHYVALVVTSNADRHLELLRPDDTLEIGYVYRLITFEEVSKRLKRLAIQQQDFSNIKQRRGACPAICGTSLNERRHRMGCFSWANWREGSQSSVFLCGFSGAGPSDDSIAAMMMEKEQEEELGSINGHVGHKCHSGMSNYRQWRPTLQSIAEVGS